MSNKLREILIKLVENVTLSPNDNAMNKAISDIQQIHKEEMENSHWCPNGDKIRPFSFIACSLCNKEMHFKEEMVRVLEGLKYKREKEWLETQVVYPERVNQRIDAKIKELKQKEE